MIDVTKKEIAQLFGAITNLYPNEKQFTAAGVDMVTAWRDLLQDIPLDIAAKAVAAHAATNNYPPTIAEIRRFCIQTDGAESAEQAWARVFTALKDGAYHSAERFAELPDACKRLVGSANVLKEWAISEDQTSIQVARARFLSQYDIELRKERERKMIPPSVRNALDAAMSTNLLSEVNDG